MSQQAAAGSERDNPMPPTKAADPKPSAIESAVAITCFIVLFAYFKHYGRASSSLVSFARCFGRIPLCATNPELKCIRGSRFGGTESLPIRCY